MSFLGQVRAQRLISSSILLLLLAGLSPGCATRYFAETRLDSDGTVQRAIWQPRSNAGRVEEQHGVWQHVVPVLDLSRHEQPLDIRRWAETHASDDGTSLAAWGEFSSTDDIPSHVMFFTPDQQQFGSLEREYSRRDLTLVMEHSWRETLHDIVSLNSMRLAREQFADSIVRDAEQLLSSQWGDQYDISGVVEWLGTSGRAWLADTVNLVYDTMARKPEDADRRLKEGFADIAANYGWNLRHPDGHVLGEGPEDESDQRWAAWENFLIGLFNDRLRRLDGQPHTPESLRQMVVEVNTMVRGSTGDEAGTPETLDEELWLSWKASMTTLVTRQYGSQEACEQHYLNLTARVIGLYLLPFTTDNARFEYVMEMPGTIVETTGRLLTEKRVEWKFDAHQAFPFGFTMTCRSLESRDNVQQALLGKTPLDNRAAILEFAGLLDRQPGLHRVLETCRDEGSLEPLHRHRRRLENQQRRESEEPANIGRKIEITSVSARLHALERLEQLLGLSAP
jgi:hypothetical protein